jgi:tRNA threonylcarbamoyladenosine biosynthesis protein TsaB
VSELVLAIDTAAEFGSLALLDGEELLEQMPLHSPDGFGHVLFGHVEALLSRHGVKIGDIALLAGGAGPGSFTGVRVALSAVKGLAAATGAKGCAVSNLAALAWHGTAARRAAVLDARRGEVYACLYDDALRPLTEESVERLPFWIERAGEAQYVLTAPGPFEAALAGRDIVYAGRELAAAMGRLAWRRMTAGEPCDARAIDANYVRRADAELQWADRS